MNTWNPFKNRFLRVFSATVAIVAVAGLASAQTRERTRDRDRDRDRDRAPAGYIGVYMQDLTDDVRAGLDLKVSKGVLVSGVEKDGPADRLGLDEGTVILSFNGKAVSTPDELRDAVRAVAPGKEASMEIVQDGKKKKVSIVVGERTSEWGWMSGPDSPRAPELRRAFAFFGGPRLGIRAHEMSDELGSYFKAKAGDGILVLEVDEKSVASAAGVKPGDVVQKIGDGNVKSVDDLRESVRDFEEGDEFTITVLRHGKTEVLKATMDDRESGREFSWMFDGRAPRMERLHRQMKNARPFVAPGQRHDDLRRELDELREELEQLKVKLEGGN